MSLLDLFHHPRLIAEDGRPGEKNNRSGRSGKDRVVPVPAGTVVIDPDSHRVAIDLNEERKTFLAAQGGRGGRGNAHFTTAVDRAPHRADKGEPGERRWLKLELKLMADVGLVGPPNTGKSTLLSKITAARPRVADYPFTTTVPGLGVACCENTRSFTVVDMPGLDQTAHQGRGLGTRFLKHIERAPLLVYVFDASGLTDHSLMEDYRVIAGQLRTFNPLFEEKRRIVAVNKVDLLQSLQPLKDIERVFTERGVPTFAISALTGRGLRSLMTEMVQSLEAPKPNSQGRESLEPQTRST
jgi:GTP-binding protein